MVTFECPWCAEPASLDADALDEIACEGCGVRVEVAPDPVLEPIAEAA
jgi:transcription elongation factor Elf1